MWPARRSIGEALRPPEPEPEPEPEDEPELEEEMKAKVCRGAWARVNVGRF